MVPLLAGSFLRKGCGSLAAKRYPRTGQPLSTQPLGARFSTVAPRCQEMRTGCVRLRYTNSMTRQPRRRSSFVRRPGKPGTAPELEHLSGREVASHLLGLIARGLMMRDRGLCLGGGAWKLPRAASSLAHQRLTRQPILRIVRLARARAHSRGQHDQGCYAFGLPLNEVVSALQRKDRVSVTPLLCEALRDAAKELTATAPKWSKRYAAETVEIHMRKRINPV